MLKRFILFTVSLIFVFTGAFAQKQLDHEKTTYTGPDGKFYINKDLPVYLRLSTSKDKGGDSHLLKSKKSKEYTNPMYFDTEGYNTIKSPWAVDQESKKTVRPKQKIVFKVYADGLSPNTSSKFHSAPRHYSGGTVYYGKNLKVKLTSNDAVSGVENIYQSVNGESYKEYSSDINMNNEGRFTLRYYASDMVGNAEDPNKKEFIVDLSSPETNHSTSQPKLNDILSPKAKITLTKSDNLSGVDYTKYGFDGSSNQGYYKPISLWNLSDGNHTLTYYSNDDVDNKESKNTYEFYLDRKPPELSSEIVGDIHKGNYTFISSRTKVKLSATDNKAGVKEIKYSIDGQSYKTYSSQFKMPTQTGKHYIKYYAEDKVTNKNDAKYVDIPGSGNIYMDDNKPSTSIKYGNPQFFDRDTLFINKNTDIYLNRNDNHSGVKVTNYKVNGGSEKDYSSAFNISEKGYHTITFRSIDNVNNEESYKESNVFVDNTAPEIYTNFSINAIGSKQKDGKTYKIYPNYTKLYIGATDIHCGTKSIHYSINGGAFQAYSSPHTLDVSEVKHFQEEKFYKVRIKVEDQLGNESQKTVRFFVGKK